MTARDDHSPSSRPDWHALLPARPPSRPRQESLGGRFERDGTFRGTRWRTVGLELPEGEEPAWDSTPAEPSADDVSALRELVSELVRRQPPRQ